ncbi:TrkH family potassium uptake protein [Alphaproteobacteria bacterium]|nr:TrkH family potassium uptake protein [Alphaproteobacteria bacterium]MDB2431291.1 TrkH family potassium uptake protein [Alphaproteobacteria bacterium]
MSDNRTIFFIIGLLLAAVSGGMLLPATINAISGHSDWQVFIGCALVTGFIAGALILTNRGKLPPLSVKQAFTLTSLSWLALTGFAALPFAFGELDMSYTDAFFEAMSGLTTTGATVITNLDSAPPGILLWRALLQWFGGIGIIVMAISVLPMLNIGGMQLFRLESSDTSEKILPRAAQIAGSITRLYFGITLACMLSYLAAGMEVFDAIAHAMTTIATGGFSTRDDSLGAFGAPVAMVAIFFMLVSAVPFVAYLQLVNRKFDKFVRDEQIRTFFLLALAAASMMWIYQLAMTGDSAGAALLSAAFNTTSILTGTGYATADYSAWGPFAISMFFILTFIGGCAGSTACGLKIFRLQVVVKAGWRYIRQLTRPNGVFVIRYNGRLLDDDVANSVVAFVLIFILTFIAVATSLSLMGLDPLTALSAAAAAIANVGPGLGPEIGPSGTYAGLPNQAKWVLAFGMLLGRLEFLTVLVLFAPSFWRR